MIERVNVNNQSRQDKLFIAGFTLVGAHCSGDVVFLVFRKDGAK